MTIKQIRALVPPVILDFPNGAVMKLEQNDAAKQMVTLTYLTMPVINVVSVMPFPVVPDALHPEGDPLPPPVIVCGWAELLNAVTAE
jgi:hypothetical protein